MRYNCSFTIEKDTIVTPKFEVIETDSKNTAYIANILQKKYPGCSIIIKYIKDSINGKGNAL